MSLSEKVQRRIYHGIMESSPWREEGERGEGVKYIVRLGEAILRESNFAEIYICIYVYIYIYIYIYIYARSLHNSIRPCNKMERNKKKRIIKFDYVLD